MKSPTESTAIGWFPFWFWNDTLDEAGIRWQIQQMAAVGVRGFIPSPRQGLTIPYLSDEFFALISIAIDEAKKHGMVVHLYDELPYPSGAAGGEVLLGNPHFHATSLVQQTVDVDGGPIRLELPCGKILGCVAYPLDTAGNIDWSCEINLRASVGIVLTQDSYQEVGLTAYNRKRYFSNVTTPTLSAYLPSGRYRVYVAAQCTVENHKYYFHWIDTLNPQAVQEFFRLTHERYFERFGSEFGNVIQSIFADETAPGWSERLPGEFARQAGCDLLPLLPALVDATHPQHAKVSADLHRIKYDLFVEAFEKPYQKWCAEHGIMYWGEKPLSRLSQLKFSDVPGCDAGHVKAGAPIDLVSAQLRMSPRAAASAAYFYDKPAALCECYHSLGWGATLQDLKWLADGLLLHGINCFVPHAFFYSTHGLRKHDAPPSMFFQMPYWRYFRLLVQQTQTVLQAFAGTHIAARVLVVDPTPGVPTSSQGEAFVHVQNLLLAKHVDYLLVDVDVLQSGVIENGKLQVKDLTIDLVIVPPMLRIEFELSEWLALYQSSGGVIAFDDNQLVAKLPPPSLSVTGDHGAVHLVTRRERDRTVWFLQNTSSQTQEITIETHPRSLVGYESLLLTSEQLTPASKPMLLKLPTDSTIHPLNPNLLPLRSWRMALLDQDGSVQVHSVEPAPIIHQLERGRFRFAPTVQRAFGSVAQLQLPLIHVHYSAVFENRFDGPVRLIMEPGSIAGDWSMNLNQGGPLRFLRVDALIPGSLGVDITPLLLTGENVIDIDLKTDRVDGGLLNCIYLAGNFGVELTPLRLIAPTLHGSFGKWEENRLPFFAGAIEYRSQIVVDSLADEFEIVCDPNLLGDDAFEISFNGNAWHALPWSPRRVRPEPGEIRAGKNELRVRLYTTLLRAFEGQRFDVAAHRATDVYQPTTGAALSQSR